MTAGKINGRELGVTKRTAVFAKVRFGKRAKATKHNEMQATFALLVNERLDFGDGGGGLGRYA